MKSEPSREPSSFRRAQNQIKRLVRNGSAIRTSTRQNQPADSACPLIERHVEHRLAQARASRQSGLPRSSKRQRHDSPPQRQSNHWGARTGSLWRPRSCQRPSHPQAIQRCSPYEIPRESARAGHSGQS